MGIKGTGYFSGRFISSCAESQPGARSDLYKLTIGSSRIPSRSESYGTQALFCPMLSRSPRPHLRRATIGRSRSGFPQAVSEHPCFPMQRQFVSLPWAPSMPSGRRVRCRWQPTQPALIVMPISESDWEQSFATFSRTSFARNPAGRSPKSRDDLTRIWPSRIAVREVVGPHAG